MNSRRWVSGVIVAGLTAALLPLAAPSAHANGNCVTYWSGRGAGTSASPYPITSQLDLEEIRYCHNTGKVFSIAADIALTSTWTPIGTDSSPFNGELRGNGHAINGLTTTNAGTESYVGLFGGISGATIDDVRLLGTIYGDTHIGGLAGWAYNSTITDVSSSVNVVMGNPAVTSIKYIGGIVGMAYGTMTISSSTASGSMLQASGVTATDIQQIGGAVGRFMQGTMTNVDATGAVQGIRFVGGLVGIAAEDAAVTITGSSATGNVTATEESGGLIGRITQGTLSDVSASGTVTTTGNSIGGLLGMAGTTSTVTITHATATGAVSGASTAGGLIGNLERGTLGDVSASGSVTTTGIYTGGLIGIAGSTSAVTVTDATATGNVTGTQGAGGLIGFFESGSVTRGQATGNVNGTSTVGGLIGGMRNTGTQTIDASSATGSVTGTLDYIGGLIGEDQSDSIADSFATGAVSGRNAVGGLTGRSYTGSMTDVHATGNVTGSVYVGGLIGDTYPAGTVTISRAFATGNVIGLDYVGGLIGWYGYTAGPPSYSTSLTDAFARGSVTATGGGGGSVIGYLHSDNPAPVRVYGTGRVSGSGDLGGLVGRASASSTTLTASFWNTQTTGRSLSSGFGTLTGVTGATTATMTTLSTYQSAGWSIQSGWAASGTTWGICAAFNSGYPFLEDAYDTDPCILPAVAGQAAPAPTMYRLTLDANGGVCNVSGVSGEAGTWVVLPAASACTRTGAEFSGWSTARDGLGLTFVPGGQTALTGDNTLYATWSATPTTAALDTSTSSSISATPATISALAISRTGARKRILTVTGILSGVTPGTPVRVWTRTRGGVLTQGPLITIGPDGRFTWTTRARKTTSVFITIPGTPTRSSTVTA